MNHICHLTRSLVYICISRRRWSGWRGGHRRRAATTEWRWMGCNGPCGVHQLKVPCLCRGRTAGASHMHLGFVRYRASRRRYLGEWSGALSRQLLAQDVRSALGWSGSIRICQWVYRSRYLCRPWLRYSTELQYLHHRLIRPPQLLRVSLLQPFTICRVLNFTKLFN